MKEQTFVCMFGHEVNMLFTASEIIITQIEQTAVHSTDLRSWLNFKNLV